LVGLLAPPSTAVAQITLNSPMYFPVIGDNLVTDTFGAPRNGHTHLGVDIMADKMTPVVAVAGGVVSWVDEDCCHLAILHDDGWESWYIHLNNDTPGTDDGQGWGFADGIVEGARVEGGQLIGWVGDSGNAEWTSPHLHFELHAPDSTVIDPYDSLLAAIVLEAPLDEEPPEPLCSEGEVCDTAALVDSGSQFHLYDRVEAGSGVSRFYYGVPGDVPLMGDWDCDGVSTPAMYRPTNGFMYLRNSNTQGVADRDYFYGNPSDLPIAGDFDGDGCDTLAIYRRTEGQVYVKNSLGTGVADYSFYFGNPGDKPFTGDFDGDGVDTVGLHRESTGFVYFRNSNSQGVADFEFFYGNPGDKLVAGDWDRNGTDTLAVYRPSTGQFYVKLHNSQGVADYTLAVGSFVASTVAGR
jgi:murein DD-endopeptidase MepM/ murein hydrolase activator NlpD